jgi:protein TonB
MRVAENYTMLRRLILIASVLILNKYLVAQRDSLAIRRCIPSPDIYQGEAVYTHVDHMPVYKSGTHDLINYISKHLIYRQENKESPLRSTFRVTFVIDTLGNPQDLCCITSMNNYEPVEKQLIELIQNTGGWTPGTKDGKKVCVRFTIPLTICLK